MEEFRQEIKNAELALSNGNYNFCIQKLKPLIEVYPVSTSEGVNIRLMLITSLCACNKKKDAIIFCKELFKSRLSNVRENAKSLLEILNAPDLETPEDWNIKFDNNIYDKQIKSNASIKKTSSKPTRFINISETPTGETKSFQEGFSFITFLFLILLITLLSGCVKINNSIDLKNINSINLEFDIHSKLIDKIPWQKQFENKMSENFTNEKISIDDKSFELRKEALDIPETKLIINNIKNIISNSIDTQIEDIQIDYIEKNYFIGKRSFLNLNLDLINLDKIDDLEINFQIISPSNVKVANKSKGTQVQKNVIKWVIVSGENNKLEFSYWSWNKILIVSSLVISLVMIAKFVRDNRYELGSGLPELPS